MRFSLKNLQFFVYLGCMVTMKRILLILLVFSSVFISAQDDKEEHRIEGEASYYARNFQGRRTASGEFFTNYDYTAAHRTLPFGTYLNVVNKKNNYNVIVRVNDRGPYAKNRVIDLSEAAARRIGSYHHGLVEVHLEVLDIIHMTPELDSVFHCAPVTDCFGNKSELTGITLSLWKTKDLLHAIYVSNDLYLKENVSKVLIGRKGTGDALTYHVLISGIENMAEARKLKDAFERKGFMRVGFFTVK